MLTFHDAFVALLTAYSTCCWKVKTSSSKSSMLSVKLQRHHGRLTLIGSKAKIRNHVVQKFDQAMLGVLSSIWADMPEKRLRLLEQLQGRCLRKIVGAKAHTAEDAVEVIANETPVRL